MTLNQSSPLGWLGILLAGLLLYHIGKADGKSSVQDAALDRETAGAQQLAHQWKVKYQAAKDDSVDRENVIVLLHQSARTEKAAADSIDRERSALSLTLPALFTTRDSLRAYARVVLLDAQEILRLRAAVEKKGAEADSLRSELIAAWKWKGLAESANVAIDSLGKALAAEHETRRCRIGLKLVSIPCPSRKTSAVLGAAAVVVVWVVHP